MKNINTNIKLSYILAFAHNLLFWMGIWLLFYLTITDYKGVGVAELVWLSISFFGEIPTGALSDLLGKKKTLIIAFFLGGLGNIVMGASQSLTILMLSVAIQSIGGVLQSGSFEAIIYDSLKEDHNEDKYSKVLTNVQSISLIATACASIIGGYLYKYSHALPFYLTGLGFFCATILSFWLKEPDVDTEIFNLKNYIQQTKQGFRQLFQKKYINLIIIIILINYFYIVMYELVGDSLVLAFGFTDGVVLGYFYAGLFIFSAFAIQFSTKILHKLGINKTLFIIGLIYAFTMIISPKLGLILGGVTIFLRIMLGQTLKNAISSTVNNISESKYRATTLSTYSMLKNTPYFISVVFVGHLIDILGAKILTMYLGIVLSIILIIWLYFIKLHPKLIKQ